MAHVISFTSSAFDTTNERPNPINPIAGQGVLAWIRSQLPAKTYEATEPETEDWGWYMIVAAGTSSYLVGASGRPDKPDAEVEWVVQIHAERNLIDKLLGRRRLSPDDQLLSLIENLLRKDPRIKNIRVGKDA